MSKFESDYMLEFGGHAISYRGNILVFNPYQNKLNKLLKHLQKKELTFKRNMLLYEPMNDNTEPMPRWWWINPWSFAISQWKARERHYAKYLEFSKAYARTNLELFELKKQIKWQPIYTAPTNKYILVSFYYSDDPNREIYFRVTHWNSDEKGWDGMSSSIRHKIVIPLCWTEIQKPPNS